tara:strand:- start:6 stop:1115 length:1110 start_codon:yes stop_codon:yes gene_type:complete
MNILGFNPSHHGSVCLLQDGELKHFIQEERIGNREKYSMLPFRSFIDILQNYKIDYITCSTPSMTYNSSSTSTFPYWLALAEKYHPKVRFIDLSQHHHLIHSTHSFYNSGFKEAIGVVIDGAGSGFRKDNTVFHETESLYYCSYPNKFEILSKNVTPVKMKINLSRVYETVTMHLGWNRNEAGKTMGLASYGKFNKDLPPLFSNYPKGDSGVMFYAETKTTYLPDYSGTFINEKKHPRLKLQIDPREWHYNESKITDLEKDLAWKVQNDIQQLVGDYIETAIQQTGLKQACCAGGYFLNCVTNYYLQKRFPDIEFYFEPIANDAGTAIGAAKSVWYKLTKDATIRPFKSLYLGKQYSKEELLEGIKKYT